MPPDAAVTVHAGEKASTYFGGSALKALGDGRVGGYLVVFGGPPDSQGEWFSPDVNLHLDWFGGTTRPILYHHGLTDQDIIEEIGFIDKLITDSRGLWAEGQLDMTNPRASQVYSDVNKGRIGWSSGSAPHLSKIDDSGCISEWAVVEASLTPTPAAGRRTTVQALKFDTRTFTPLDQTGIDHSAGNGPTIPLGERQTKRNSKGTHAMNVKAQPGLIGAMSGAGIDPADIIKVLMALEEGDSADTGGMMTDPIDVTATPTADATMSADVKDAGPTVYGDGGAEIEDTGPKPAMTPPAQATPGTGTTNVAGKALAKTAGIDGNALATVLKYMMATVKAQPAPSRAQGAQFDNPTRAQQTRISNMKTQFHDMSAADMAFLYEVRRQGKKPREMGLEFEREMATKAMKEYDANKLDLVPEVARKVAMKLDFNNTTTANDGANWVPDLWSSILWMRVRIDNNVAKNIEVFQMPSPTFEYPIESTDPVVYAVGESDTDAEQTLATNVFTRSKVVTSKLQFAAKKTGLQVGFSTEIEEDSIIPFIPQLRAQATRAFANSIDYNILNSDSTTGTGNINYKGANTSAAPTSNFLFGGGNGMRYNALVSNTAVQVNMAGGQPTLASLRSLRFKLISALNAYGINPEDLVIITEPLTYGKFLSIDEINVDLNNGRNATVNTGIVPNIDGTPVFASAEMKLADNVGYVAADGTSTLGNWLIFAKNAWKVGYVRQVMTDVSYVPWNDAYILTMTARYAIGKKDTSAAGLAFNVNVS